MISITRVKYYVKIEEVWFSGRKKNDKHADIISYCQSPERFAKVEKTFKSLVNDLSNSEETLFDSFHKNTRYEIRRAQKEDIEIDMFFSGQISGEMIKEVADFYFDFAEGKGLTVDWDSRDFISYLESFWTEGNLAISTASINGKIIVYHVYIYDDTITGLFLSASHYRKDDAVPSNLAGMANRLLHFKDMMAFKSAGLKTYDWGGISDEAEIQNISDFKRKFGGEERDSYYVTEPVTLKGRLALLAKKFLR